MPILRAVVLACLTALLAAGALAAGNPQVEVRTTAGTFTMELYPEDAPKTVENFLAYVDQAFYEGLIFHRVIPGFVIQAGAYTPELEHRQADRDPVVNESIGGLRNERGTVAMARLRDPDSARAQFYVNLRDTERLDARNDRPGYTVFGRVIEGFDVVEAINEAETDFRADMFDVPVEPVVIERMRRLDADGRAP